MSLSLNGFPGMNIRIAVFASYEATCLDNDELARDAAELFSQSCTAMMPKPKANAILQEFAQSHNVEQILALHTHQDSGMDEFFPNLFISSQVPANDLATLQKLGITHIICCTEGHEAKFPQHFQYLFLDIKDRRDVDLHVAIETSNAFVSTALHTHHTHSTPCRVLFYCGAGMSRSAAVALGYLVGEEKMPLQIAYVLMKTARPLVNPNPGFIHSLQIMEEQRTKRVMQVLADDDDDDDEHAPVEPA